MAMSGDIGCDFCEDTDEAVSSGILVSGDIGGLPRFMLTTVSLTGVNGCMFITLLMLVMLCTLGGDVSELSL